MGMEQDKLDKLHPVMRRKVMAVLKDLRGHGREPLLWETFRTRAKQLEYFKQGYSKVKFGFHCAMKHDGSPCALAADIIDLHEHWDADAEFWRLLHSSAKAHGLHRAAAWDKPHIQLLPNNELKRVKAGWLPPLDNGQG